MQPTTAAPATGGIQSTHRLQHIESQLYIRLHCEPRPFGDGLRIVPQLARQDKASRFPSYDAAVIVAATYLPHTPVEIVRVDA